MTLYGDLAPQVHMPISLKSWRCDEKSHPRPYVSFVHLHKPFVKGIFKNASLIFLCAVRDSREAQFARRSGVYSWRDRSIASFAAGNRYA
jgi:hypothetical protein